MAYQMSDGDKETLRTNRLYLLKNVVPNEFLLGYLNQEKVLTDDMIEEIQVEKTTKAKVSKLLDVLPRRGPKAFKEFMDGLMESEQEHVTLKLAPELAELWQSQNATSTKDARNAHRPPTRQSSGRPRPLPRQPSKPPNYKSPDNDDESPLLTMDVTPADDVDVLKLLANTKDVYRMTGKPRGRAVIINNSYFVSNAPREGAAFDSLNLCKHFEQLLFETVLYDESTAEDIRNILEDERQHEAHYNADCFVLFILSHGANGFIYGIDGQRLSIERDIVTPFDGANCPALVDKPKLFFVQACQGDAVTEGITATGTGDSEVDASPIQEESMPEVEQAFRDLRIQDTDQTMPRLSHTHEKSDIVLAYSTVPGYRAWRRTDLGSWFVRAIVQVFSAEACKEDVLSLLVKVRQRVAENQTNHEDSSFVQLTRTDETTKKKIYFFPGYYETQRGDRV